MVSNDNDSGICPICYDDVYIVNYTLPCGHTFHKHCLKQWTKKSNTCPICRTLLLRQYICYNKKCKFLFRACMIRLNENFLLVKEYGSKTNQYNVNNLYDIKLNNKMVKFIFKLGKYCHKYNLLFETHYFAKYFYNDLLCSKKNNDYHNLQAQMMHINNNLLNN